MDPEVTVVFGINYEILNVDVCKTALLLCLTFHEIVMYITGNIILLIYTEYRNLSKDYGSFLDIKNLSAS